MKLSGPTLRLRPVRLSDMLLFASCYEDWPADRLGFYTIDRAGRECDIAVRDNRTVSIPLDDASAWTQTLAIYTDEMPNGIGIHRAKAEGRIVTVLNQAFVPEARGRGYFNELQTILQRYAFDVLGATEARFDILADSIGAVSHVSNRAKYVIDGAAVGVTGMLKVGRLRKADRDEWVRWNKGEAEAPFEFEP